MGPDGVGATSDSFLSLEEPFRLAVEASPSGMVMVNEEGTIVLVNRETERLFGYARQKLLGKSIEFLVPDAARERHPELRSGFRSEPSRREMGSGRDLYGRHEDGSEVPVEIGLNPIRTADGLFVLASIVDISERKRAQDELRRSNAELEHFAYVASHDLQEPLRMVASYTELLQQRYEGRLDEKADKYIRYAVDGAKRLQRLIHDLLPYSRVNTEAEPLAPVDADELVRCLLDRALGRMISEAGAVVHVDTLPEVMADETQVEQVFQNLIANAIKFRHGDRAPEVWVAAEPSDDGWRFAIRDNGIGIEAEYKERVFEMFQRLHGIGEYPGSGLGLALCRKIVERHDGRIWLESEVDQGSTFYFTLPDVR